MSSEFAWALQGWPKKYISVNEINSFILPKRSRDSLNGYIKRGVSQGLLQKVINGHYIIIKNYNQKILNPYELANSMDITSYISFQSALSLHGWIPEGVYAITSATSKRSRKFFTKEIKFIYRKVPLVGIMVGVERFVEDDVTYLLATPWKAIADMYFFDKREWYSLKCLHLDLRIEYESFFESDLNILKELSQVYGNLRVRKLLKKIYKELIVYDK